MTTNSSRAADAINLKQVALGGAVQGPARGSPDFALSFGAGPPTGQKRGLQKVGQISLDIHTDRLVLRPLTPSFLELSLAGDRLRAGDLLGCDVSDEWFEESDLASLRLDDLRAEPRYQEWSLRAMIEQAGGRMVGHIGFHTRPGPAYLAPWTPEGVEVGYTVYPQYRRIGYARGDPRPPDVGPRRARRHPVRGVGLAGQRAFHVAGMRSWLRGRGTAPG